MEHYIDNEGNVIVSKSIRPIIEYPETFLRSKRGAEDSSDMEICILESMMSITRHIWTKLIPLDI